jgi:hypothetical protein
MAAWAWFLHGELARPSHWNLSAMPTEPNYRVPRVFALAKTWLRGKSGLPEAAVPGNARAEQSDGKRHRNETTLNFRGKGETVG